MPGLFITLTRSSGMPSSPEAYTTTDYTTIAGLNTAIGALTAGQLLSIHFAASPNAASGGPPSPEVIGINPTQIRSAIVLA